MLGSSHQLCCRKKVRCRSHDLRSVTEPGYSDTYHAWSLVGAYNYWLHSGDTDWMKAKWDQYRLGIAYLAAKVDSSVGLLNATGSKDWGRLGGGGFSLAPNALYYKVCPLDHGAKTTLSHVIGPPEWR